MVQDYIQQLEVDIEDLEKEVELCKEEIRSKDALILWYQNTCESMKIASDELTITYEQLQAKLVEKGIQL